MTDDLEFPEYEDTDPERLSINGEPETIEARRARKKTEAANAIAQVKLTAKLIKDPTSDQGTISYAEGQSPEELAAAAPNALAEPTTEIERIEREHGFTFSAPGDTVSPPPSRTVICRDPECPNRGEQIAVHPDTPQPIHCGGCGTVLLCDHTTENRITTSGTLAAPIKISTETCTRCGTVVTTTREELPPINLADLPIGILDLIGTTPGNVTFGGGRADSL